MTAEERTALELLGFSALQIARVSAIALDCHLDVADLVRDAVVGVPSV